MPLDTTLRNEIAAAVDAGFSDQVAYTQALVRFPSVRGHEHTIQDFVFRALKDRGYTVERLAIDRRAIEQHQGGSKLSDQHSDAPVVVGIFRPRNERGGSLILQGHVDVVPPGPADQWTHPPFAAEIEGDWLYGRGAADMKAGDAANVFALDALRRVGLQPAATTYIESIVEEESTGNGALMTHLQGYRADAVLSPEACCGESLVRANVGVLWFLLHVRGRPVHVERMGTGANAIDAAYRVIGALRKLEAAWNREKSGRAYFSELDHPINLNIGRIEAGDWASSVPAWCRVDCRMAIYPGVRAADAAREIEETVAAFARDDPYLANNPPQVEFNGFFAEGYVLAPGSEAEQVLAEAHRSVLGGTLGSLVAPAYLDTRVNALYDRVPALCYGPIGEDSHGYDERVSLASIKRITTVMALFIAEWCGVEPYRPAAS